MIGHHAIILIGGAAFLFVLLGLMFPLRPFKQKQIKKHLLFHTLFVGVVLGEVTLLEKFKFFNGRFLNLQSLSPFWLRAIVCLIALDLLSYLWHRLNHTKSFLWRWHKFHHQTEVMDPLAAYRFHPIEVFLGYQLRAAVIGFLGFGSDEVAFFVLIYGLLNLFQHSNIRLPSFIDTWLSRLVVTPSLHHVHHMREKKFQNSNYSTIFIFWDKALGTYSSPGAIRENDIGLNGSH